MFALLALTALVCMTVAEPWYAAGYCADLHDQCTTAPWVNDCAYNPTVRRECPQTCGVCSGLTGTYSYMYYPSALYNYYVPACTDAIKGCYELAVAGWCNYEQESNHAGLVSTNCKRSCGLC